MKGTAMWKLVRKICNFTSAAAVGGIAVGSPLLAGPAATTGEDRTLAPYFFIAGGEPGVDRLPLKSTQADVHIAGPLSEVIVTQVYRNDGQRTLEAAYVFPASTRAAVHGLRMSVGDRVIEAVVKEHGQARVDYEQARAAGRTASLLEQQRSNVFQMNVANILPGDEVKVQLRYTELIVPEAGIYEFVFPTVVGPRYTNQPASGAPDRARWVESPYQRLGEPPTYDFNFAATITAGVPIVRLACPSHRTAVTWKGRFEARIQLARGEAAAADRDLVLRYQLAGERIEAGLQLLRGRDENLFLLTAQPPARPTQHDTLPREYLFVLDVSGSMDGFPLDICKALLRDVLQALRPTDSFNVLLFAGGSSLLAERSLPASASNIRRALELVDGQRGGGGTELLRALQRALAVPRDDSGSRIILVMTDGYVTVEREVFALVRNHLDRANLFAFGIGTSVNRLLIEGLARAGLGEPFVVTKPVDAAAVAARFRRTIATPVLTDLRLEFEGFDAFDVQPAHLPDLLAERPVVVVGKWRGPAGGRIVLSGQTVAGTYRRSFDVAAAPEAAGEALRYLWARRRIAEVGDDWRFDGDCARAAEIRRLGLAYNLLTELTSFVAVDTRVRGDGRPAETVVQPLPLPAGVSERAVGSDKWRYRETSALTESMRLLQPSSASAEPPPCLWAAARRWRFPAAAGDSTVIVELRLVGERAQLDDVTSRGFLSADAARSVVAAGVAALGDCLGRNATLTLALAVNAAGAVTRVELVR